MTFRAFRVSLSALVLTLTAETLSAGSITVLNPSFEILPVGSFNAITAVGDYNSGIGVLDWNVPAGSTLVGQYQPALGVAFNTLDDGPTSVYSDGNTISQTVTPVVQAGDVYTLTVDFGRRLDQPFGATADLLVDGVQYAATGTTPALGGWSAYTATYTGLVGDVGDAITIELRDQVDGGQANFDNVRLSDTGTSGAPEPSTIALLCAGIALLVGSRKHFGSGSRRAL